MSEVAVFQSLLFSTKLGFDVSLNLRLIEICTIHRFYRWTDRTMSVGSQYWI